VSAATIRRLASIEELDDLGDAWDGLVRASPRPSPFLLRDWLVPWWAEFADDAGLDVAVAERGGRPVAALPLCVRRRAGIAVAGFAGGTYAEIADVLLAEDESAAVARELVHSFRGDVLHVFGLPAESVLADALAPSAPKLVLRAEGPVVSLAGGWEAVSRAKLSTQRRRHQRKRLRQLGQQGRLELRVARTASELGPALEECFRLHDLRWTGLPDRSGFTTPAGRRFHRAAVQRLAASDTARIALIELDGRAAASYYYLRIGSRAYGVSTAYEPALSRFSPGWLGTLFALESAAAEGAERFELLGGLERYKLVLADSFAPTHEAFALARTPAARAYVAFQLAALQTRRALKGIEPVRRAYYGAFDVRRRLLRRPIAATEA
jgi:CelD/BcsL family acetyltransferase involved in cellulose biosynthesis